MKGSGAGSSGVSPSRHRTERGPSASTRTSCSPTFTETMRERTALAPRLHHVVCEPGSLQVRCTYAVDRPLPRRFIPGIHKHIPIAAQVDDGDWIAYEAPPTVLDALKAGGLDPLAFVRRG